PGAVVAHLLELDEKVPVGNAGNDGDAEFHVRSSIRVDYLSGISWQRRSSRAESLSEGRRRRHDNEAQQDARCPPASPIARSDLAANWTSNRAPRADLPLLLILVGVIGGWVGFGLLGLFLGPVIIGIGSTVLQRWMGVAKHSTI